MNKIEPKLLSDAQIAKIQEHDVSVDTSLLCAEGYLAACHRHALLSHIAALQQRNEELRAFIDKHAHHDFLCELHVCQWDENERVGKPRHGSTCTCGYATDAAALSKSTQEPTR